MKIFGSRPTYVGEVWSKPVSVEDIWSVSMSVEDVNSSTDVPGGLSPCEYVEGPVGQCSERSIGR